jgi:hypothetical protein
MILKILVLSLILNASVAANIETVCQTLDKSRSLSGTVVTVRGYIRGSRHHGYNLHATTTGPDIPCPGWNEKYFTAPSVIALNWGTLAATHSPSGTYGDIDSWLAPQGLDGTGGAIVVTGLLHRKWIIFIFRMAAGGYAGNGYGESGGLPASLDVRSIAALPR